ncbi:MAG: hypothetical protein HOO67_03345 [Candidatus Peribacteraceae bacterium]|nr:hypothetical protein [Candidatus Peribacteraceae bacterium]
MGLIFNPNLYPPSGYIFQDADGTKFRGESWRDVRRQIAEYRARNGMPAGDPEAEINAQQCAQTPGLCHGDKPVPVRTTNSGTNGNERVMNWLGSILISRRQNGTPAVVDKSTARERAAICALCSRQRALSAACDACLNTIRDSRKAILGGEKPVHEALHTCGVLGEDCVSSVHLDLAPVADPELPGNCWRRQK